MKRIILVLVLTVFATFSLTYTFMGIGWLPNLFDKPVLNESDAKSIAGGALSDKMLKLSVSTEDYYRIITSPRSVRYSKGHWVVTTILGIFVVDDRTGKIIPGN